ncbi:glycosyltransferase family 4 protein [Candidatus Auribacterota bacterium]
MKKIGINWPLSSLLGWGIFSTHIVLQLIRQKKFKPILLKPTQHLYCNKLIEKTLLSYALETKEYHGVKEVDFPLLHPLGNAIAKELDVVGSSNIGLIFIENTELSENYINNLNSLYDVIVAGSSWNYHLLYEKGIKNVLYVSQGIDKSTFHPSPKSGLYDDRFVIFSGGKLEYRKGQDLVVAAYKKFYASHPEALLIFSWDNLWPASMKEITSSGHVSTPPNLNKKGKPDFDAWLVKQGLPKDSFINLGMVPNYMMPSIIREADIGLFPNRAEGGTNLVAMETIASGIPSILSNNTGHRDIINYDDCFILEEQSAVKPTQNFPGTEGWGESSVQEILENLESAYQQKKNLAEKGRQASRRMHQTFSWEKQISDLLNQLEPYLG